MAKDPAMLWYWSDWHSGTTTLSRFLKGCYMDVLHAQFNSGHLTLEEIRTVLGSDFGQSWPTLQKKFAVDDTGKYFNVRLEQEQMKRVAYTASRRKNLESSHMDNHKVKHMDSHMENVNENGNSDFKTKKESAKLGYTLTPTIIEPATQLRADELCHEALCRLAKAHRVYDMENLMDRWEGWYMSKFDWKKKDFNEYRKSFEGWIKDPKSRQQVSANGKSLINERKAKFEQQ